MTALDLLVQLHKNNPRQGPGSDTHTRLAIELTGLHQQRDLAIADIGCGTGASALVLARTLGADITAVDIFPAFLELLENRALEQGLSNIITPCVGNMTALPFADQSLDVIWAEGAIYTMGFCQGLEQWRRFLKPGGILAVSEITWLTDTRPGEIDQHWSTAYPEINTASAKMHTLEQAGYSPLGYFVLPKSCWQEHYYSPLQAGFDTFLAQHPNDEMARTIVDDEQEEIRLYNKYNAYYSYGFYIAQKA